MTIEERLQKLERGHKPSLDSALLWESIESLITVLEQHKKEIEELKKHVKK